MVMVTIFGGSIMCVVTVSPGKLIPCSGMASDAKWSTWTVDKWGWLVNHMRVSIYVICSDVSKHSLMFHPAAHVVQWSSITDTIGTQHFVCVSL